jgi:hypothetical protein
MRIISSFLLKGKRNKTFEACKEIPAPLRYAGSWSALALHAPFPPLPLAFLRGNAIPRRPPLFLDRLRFLFFETNKFYFCLKQIYL